ncbi:uncharacterized protein BT62DRAFT_1003500 [Guyanagaster necrorhizus]|uniref:Uncharacterized protein n=1 Tax=Guyanagaster necrorhizus TaxID=856835 RepID=A0A9P7VWF7_9AGAR|nr:uncharacterized protein BT62DRAFT_1003500 [Guyanagaster necrorhizus MCA 3950]KAG7448786.1 hypothetical protein BT62DRAFT_1003500 [Guyanagaster necrorhizus MCA 3950]
MDATDAILHLDAVARSIPKPVFPPDALNSQIIPNIKVLQQQISVYDALLDRIDQVRSKMQSRRDAVYKSMVAYSSTLAPIRHLTNDVFRAVFREIQISLWWNKEDRDQMLDFSQASWTLSHSFIFNGSMDQWTLHPVPIGALYVTKSTVNVARLGNRERQA